MILDASGRFVISNRSDRFVIMDPLGRFVSLDTNALFFYFGPYWAICDFGR